MESPRVISSIVCYHSLAFIETKTFGGVHISYSGTLLLEGGFHSFIFLSTHLRRNYPPPTSHRPILPMRAPRDVNHYKYYSLESLVDGICTKRASSQKRLLPRISTLFILRPTTTHRAEEVESLLKLKWKGN